MTAEPPWQEHAERLKASAPFRTLARSLGVLAPLPVPVAAWVVDLLADELGRPALVVVPHESEALAWVQMLALLGTPAEYFAAPSLTPYQEAEVSLHARAQESVALDRVLAGRCRTLVATPRALFRRLPEAADFRGSVVTLRRGGRVELETLATHLVAHGYVRHDLVGEVGEFAVRGGVFDLFPPGEDLPVRLDLWGDEIESLRRFDPVDQRSRGDRAEVRLLPLTPFAAGADEAARLATELEAWRESPGSGAGLESDRRIEGLREAGRFGGWENYLPLLAPRAAGLDRLAGEKALRVVLEPEAARAEARRHAEDLAADCAASRERGALALPPERLERPFAEVEVLLDSGQLAIGSVAGSAGVGAAVEIAASSTDVLHHQTPRFPREVETAAARGERFFFVGLAEHHSRFERLAEHYKIPLGAGGVEYVEGDLDRGFRLPGAGLVVFGERQVFRPAPAPQRGRRPGYGAFLSGLRDLKVGDYVVHEDHGIGQFVGLRTVGESGPSRPELPAVLATADKDKLAPAEEVMEILYHGGQTLLLPPNRLDLIQRYSAVEGVAPRLDRLGGTSWARTKEKVRAGMRKLAGDLLRLYAERELAAAPVMRPDSDLQSQFEAAFEHEPTRDQLEVIAAIKKDLEGRRPMDRLLCGDVGFGKTEVAMRAAFKAVDNGYQVAILAPTTILADQHFETLRRRFAGFPVEIEMVSRFRSRAEIAEIRQRVAAGRVDVLVGTHRLLSRDVGFQRLGLLVVDEEQRFGVAQKERLKNLKKDVHVLAMTATPVPRTLQLSLAGVRDLSTIETAPRDRMAVETSILPFSPELVREMVDYELDRGGQIFYVYNRVAGIGEMAARLREICPRARLVVGHGQMGERELAHRMHAFQRGEYDLLLATTIIENGIDIPNVNTIAVHRADHYGLAQLYQLRGRVGRSSRLAYCYLLTAPDRVLTEVSRQRLEAIREFTELGAGFRVAARDLEIRGAGNLLGAEQSGHIAAVGLETYLKMLEQTVRELRGETVAEGPSAAIHLPVEATIPPEYLADTNLRMEFYKRIAEAATPRDELLAELRDRFGAPPPPVVRLLDLAFLKRQAETLRVQSISFTAGRLQIRFRRDTRADAERLIEMVSADDDLRFSPTGVLTVAAVERSELLPRTREILDQVTPAAGEEIHV